MEQVPLLKAPRNSKGFKKPKQKKEESLQIAVARFLMMKYPDVIFNSDIASGMRLTIGQAVKAKMMRSESGQPDLIIMEARGPFYGLCLELKKDKDALFLKDGKTYKKSEHIDKQAAMLERLRKKGYHAVFVCGIDEAMFAINYYMMQEINWSHVSYKHL